MWMEYVAATKPGLHAAVCLMQVKYTVWSTLLKQFSSPMMVRDCESDDVPIAFSTRHNRASGGAGQGGG